VRQKALSSDAARVQNAAVAEGQTFPVDISPVIST